MIVRSIRMGMSERSAAALDEALTGAPAAAAQPLLDQLWLRTVLVEQRRRVRVH